MLTSCYYSEKMVGVKGFEPSTPASRTQAIALKGAVFLTFESCLLPILASNYAKLRKWLYACCVNQLAPSLDALHYLKRDYKKQKPSTCTVEAFMLGSLLPR